MDKASISAGAGFPKVELHCHLEGTVAPVLAQRLAARHDLDLSAIIDAQGRYRFANFSEFIAAYDKMSEAIRTPDDYFDILYDYYRVSAGEGLIYGEMFFSPLIAARHGISYTTFVETLAGALDAAERDFGVVGRLILTAVRHEGVAAAEEAALLAQAHPHPKVTGFGLAGEENFGAPRDFARAFAMARDAGLRLTAHAGELAGPESVRGALDDLNVERIGHGVRAIEDPALVAELRDRGVTLEVCPSSNVVLGLFPSIEAHPVARLAQAGVKVSLGSDDPPFVFTTIGEEYQRVELGHKLDAAALLGFTLAGLEAAFCEGDIRADLTARATGWKPGDRGIV